LARRMNFAVQIVKDSNLEAFFVKAIDQMATDEPSTTSDKNAHNRTRS
jgi:hypothetical protein